MLREAVTVAVEDGVWIMRGLDWDDPSRVQTWEELIELIEEVGFLPLFKNQVDGFSAEEKHLRPLLVVRG